MDYSLMRLKLTSFANREIVKSTAVNYALGIFVFIILNALGAFVYIRLPFTPVPFTLQNLFVVISGAIMGPAAGFLSQAGYMLLGGAGFPIFYGGYSGVIHLFGPTGGYILGFVFSAWLMGKIIYGKKRNFLTLCGCFSLGMLLILIFGTLQLSFFIRKDLVTTLKLGMLPFILTDFLKAIIASALVFQLKPGVKR
ncbi:MAG: biotin transporter BioY [Candidatus Omnitrophica bacterium]|nr:biotin transporter BioY [Candidatus Omnitrophota bacterium]